MASTKPLVLLTFLLAMVLLAYSEAARNLLAGETRKEVQDQNYHDGDGSYHRGGDGGYHDGDGGYHRGDDGGYHGGDGGYHRGDGGGYHGGDGGYGGGYHGGHGTAHKTEP
ncbi:hypothetical protein AXF42_Ash008395 [Apostasia shenzhenica]|uniref:Uncharacterized protein n=1 Tax=Apostasia shenzhenica TaxID=1088818 RepID=A0A2I0AXT3_9ASPA|nr:hypothetical protein AXF42_Ash008395 [Apostasia shenzhenica]